MPPLSRQISIRPDADLFHSVYERPRVCEFKKDIPAQIWIVSSGGRMSAFGQKQTCAVHKLMSVLGKKEGHWHSGQDRASYSTHLATFAGERRRVVRSNDTVPPRRVGQRP